MAEASRDGDQPSLWPKVLFWIAIALLVSPVTLWLGLGLGAQAIGYRPFRIPGQSMAPAVRPGDYLLAAPLGRGALERGDVLIFKVSRDPQAFYVKRLIGLPGDRIAMRDGLLRINDHPVAVRRLDEPDDEQANEAAAGIRTEQRCMRRAADDDCVTELLVERLPNSREHVISNSDDNLGPFDNTDEFDVPDGMLFVLGDNRDNSNDSRGGIGYVPIDNVLYRNGFIWYSTVGGLSRWVRFLAPDETPLNSEQRPDGSE